MVGPLMTDRLQPPAYLSAEGREIWADYKRRALSAGVTARLTAHHLEALVASTLEHRRAATLLSQTDILVNRGGNPVENPALAVRDRAARAITDLERKLGLHRITTPINAGDPTGNRGRWCETHKRWECTSDRAHGLGLCHAVAALGVGRCRFHAGVKLGDDPAHLLALQRRVNPLAGEPMDIGPAQALLWRVRVLAGEVSRLDVLIASLTADELVWGKVEESELAGGDQDSKRAVYASRLNTWLQLRAQREHALQAACEAALRSDIEERLVRLAEAEGAVIHRFTLRLLAAFGVAADDERIPVIVPGLLREIGA